MDPKKRPKQLNAPFVKKGMKLFEQGCRMGVPEDGRQDRR